MPTINIVGNRWILKPCVALNTSCLCSMNPYFRVMHLKSQITAWPSMLGLTEDKWVRLNFEMKAIRWVPGPLIQCWLVTYARKKKAHEANPLSSQSHNRDPLFHTNLTVSRLTVSILQFRMAIIAIFCRLCTIIEAYHKSAYCELSSCLRRFSSFQLQALAWGMRICRIIACSFR
jgi:hypothetical protein